MAPPRQRPVLGGGGAGDDSRSEASSTATGGPISRGIPGPKPRKSAANAAGAGSGAATMASGKELKVAAATGAAAAAAANANAAAASGLGQQNGVDMYGLDGLRDDLPGVRSYRTTAVVVVELMAFWWIDSMAPNAPLNPARLQTRIQTLYTKRIRPTYIENLFLLWHWPSLTYCYRSEKSCSSRCFLLILIRFFELIDSLGANAPLSHHRRQCSKANSGDEQSTQNK